MSDLLDESLTGVLTLLNAKKVSSAELVRASLKRIDETRELNAFITVCGEEATAAAQRSDARRARGEALGALEGVPVAVKDNISTEGIRTTCASRFLDNYVPPFDATVVGKLKAAGAVLVGKTNLDEFAMGSTNENSAFGPVRNAADPTRVPGGSSGGSASCVAAGQAYAALGSDTGGSIRQPAAYCGVVGFKPTYSLVSRYGLVAFASSLDQIGPLTRTVADSALMLNVLAGHDARDTTSSDKPTPDYTGFGGGVKGMTVGLAKEFLSGALSVEVRAAIDRAVKTYESMGVTVREVSIGSFGAALATYYVLSSAEAAANLARFDGVKYGRRVPGGDIDELYVNSRTAGFGTEVKRRIMIGNYVLSSGYYDAYYLKALKVRTLIKADYEKALEGCDALMGPVAPTVAPLLNAKETDSAKVYLSDIYTVPVNIAGLPAISLPALDRADGLPVGFQLIGRAFSEPTLLRLAAAYEKER